MKYPQVEVRSLGKPRSIVTRPPIQPACLPLRPDSPQPNQTAHCSHLEQLLRQFDEQVQYMNQLAIEREMVLLQLIAILQQVEATGDSVERERQFAAPAQPQIFGQTANGQPANGQTAKSGLVRLLPIVRSLLEAIATLIIQLAAAVRLQLKAQLSRSADQSSRSKQFRSQQFSSQQFRRPISRQQPTSRSQELQPNFEEPAACRKEIAVFPNVQAAISLTLAAALLRIGLDWLVQIYPGLWFVTTLLMVLPAAAAIYQSNRSPQSGFLWGMRLTLILIGLLLGGRI